MATLTTYQYSITGSTPNQKVSLRKLDEEIRTSTITVALDGLTQIGDDELNITFKDELPESGSLGDQELILSGVLAAHDGVPPSDPKTSSTGAPIFALEKRQDDGAPLVAVQGRVGSEAIYATHNFCDPTTWYGGSVRFTSASMTQSGSYWYHTGSAGCWTDMTHGKVFDEEGLSEDQEIFANANGGDPHGYSVYVEVSGVAKTERAAFATTGGDYVVDYVSGTITPVSGQDWSGETVVASWSEKSDSVWILEPLPGKVLVMEKAEVQFSSDVLYTDTLVMEVYGYAAVFAPQYIQANGGPLPNDARVSIDKTLYKTIDQIIDEAINAYPVIPAMGGAPRGFSKSRNVFQFHYGAVRKLYSSLGLQVRISLENGVDYGGERATATFYCTSLTDPGQTTALTELGLI